MCKILETYEWDFSLLERKKTYCACIALARLIVLLSTTSEMSVPRAHVVTLLG